jgi:hypothetical protein
LGAIEYSQEKYADATANLLKSIDAYPIQPDPVVVLRLALALDKQGKYTDALQDANRAVELTQNGTVAGTKARQERDRLLQLTVARNPAASSPSSASQPPNASAQGAQSQPSSAAESQSAAAPLSVAGSLDAHDCITRGVAMPGPGEGSWPVLALQNRCSKTVIVRFAGLAGEQTGGEWTHDFRLEIEAGKSTTHLKMSEYKFDCVQGQSSNVYPDPSCSRWQVVWTAVYKDSNQEPERPNVPRRTKVESVR